MGTTVSFGVALELMYPHEIYPHGVIIHPLSRPNAYLPTKILIIAGQRTYNCRNIIAGHVQKLQEKQTMRFMERANKNVL